MRWAAVLLALMPALALAREPPRPSPSPDGARKGEPPPLRALDGVWEGPLVIGAVRLRLVAKIKADGAGFGATVDSIDQAAKDIPVARVIWKDPALTLELPAIASVFAGTMSGNGMQIAGRWKQGGLDTPITFMRVDKPSELRRPQEPRPPYPYDPIEVWVENKAAGVTLAGTLTRPSGKGPFPAVLLITGSGPQDRDESLMGHKPFWVIADALTRRGVAVLRVDDRGVGKSTGERKRSTTHDYATDTLACVAFLKSRPEIDGKRIGLVGHSEGGLIAPMVASQSKDVAFVVLLAGTGLPGEQILYQQQALIARAGGSSDDQIKKARAEMERIYAIINSEKQDEVARKKIIDLKSSDPLVAKQLDLVLSPWFRVFLTLDPRPYLQKVRVPVLALNGERDLQVPPKENLEAIAAALKTAKNTDVTTRELPGLNHLFQTCKTGAPSEYTGIEETFAPSALQLMGDWIVAHTR